MRWFLRFLAVSLLVVAAAVPALAGWRDDIKVLRVGAVAPRGAAYDIARLEPFRAYLQNRLGLAVEIVPVADYNALIDAQSSGSVQYAIQSASSYVTAEALCACVEPIAAPTAFDGSHGFHAVLVTHSSGDVGDLASARGKRLALSQANSVAGRLVPLQALAAQGIDPKSYFSSVITATDPEQAVTMLFTDEADVAAGWSSLAGDPAKGYSFGVFTRMVADGSLSMDRLKILWQSKLISFGPHVVRKDLPDELKSLISAALLAMAKDAPDALDAVDASSIGGGGFVPVTAADYSIINDLVTGAGATNGG